MNKITPGDQFGEWTVIARSKNKPGGYWQCQCSCGVRRNVWISSLVQGRSKSCGHIQALKKAIKYEANYIGKMFGRLKPIKRLTVEKNPIYLCLCSCGNSVEVRAKLLRTGSTKSCGCLRRENSKILMSKIQKKGHESLDAKRLDGTSIDSLKQKTSKNNKTGVKGVSKLKDSRFRAYINLKKKQKHLGIFDTLKGAKNARVQAEKLYFDPIIRKWDSQ